MSYTINPIAMAVQSPTAAEYMRLPKAGTRDPVGIKNLPAGKSEPAIFYPASEAGPILIPLSVPLKQQISDLAIESGLTRPEAAKILLRKTDWQALARTIGEATGPARLGWWAASRKRWVLAREEDGRKHQARGILADLKQAIAVLFRRTSGWMVRRLQLPTMPTSSSAKD